MDTSQEKFGEEFDAGSSQIPQDKGRFELHGMPKQRIQALREEFEINFDSLGHAERLQMLEEFLAYGAIGEDGATTLAEKLEFEEREKLGEFLAKNIKPGSYTKLFHEQWYYLYPETKNELVQKIMRDCPEEAIAVAPFVDLSNYIIPEKEKGAKKPRFAYSQPPTSMRRKYGGTLSIYEKYFNNLLPAKELIEACIRKPEENGTSAVIEYYAKNHPEFLFPYLPRLVDEQIITSDKAKELLLGKEGESSYYIFKGKFYESTEEEQQFNTLIEKVKELWKEKTEDFMINLQEWPDNLRMKAENIEANAKKRALAHMFGNFSEYGKRFLVPKERVKFMKRLIENYMPILYSARELEISEKDIDALAAEAEIHGENISFLEDFDDIRVLITQGLEEKAADLLVRQMSSQEHEYMKEWLVQRVDTVLRWFSDKNGERIIRAITENSPQTWFLNPDYAEKNGGINMLKLIQDAEREGYSYLNHYRRIFFYVQKAEKEGRSPGTAPREVRRKGRMVFSRMPEQAFWKQRLFKELFPGPEQKDFIKKHLQSGDQYFRYSTLEEFVRFETQSENRSRERPGIDIRYAKKDLEDVFRKNPDSFMGILEDQYGGWKDFKHVFAPDEVFKIFFAHIDSADTCAIVDKNPELVNDLLYRPRDLKRFLDTVFKKGDVLTVAAFVSEVRSILKQDSWARSGSVHVTAEDKKRKLPDTSRLNLKHLNQTLVDFIEKKCGEKKFLVFEEGILALEEVGLKALAKREIAEYGNIHPEAIPSLDRYMSRQTIETAVESNPRAFAFMRDKYNRPIYHKDGISAKLLEKLESINPLLRFEEGRPLEDDYYLLVLKELEKNPFLDISKNRLEKIAREEFKKNGPRTDMRLFTPNKEFYDTASRLFLLHASPDIRDAKDAILALPQKERDELIPALEFLTLYNFDRFPGFSESLAKLAGNYQETKQNLEEQIKNFVQELFELEKKENTGGSLNGLDAETIQALSIYYNIALRKNRLSREPFRQFMEKTLDGDYHSWRTWGDATTAEGNKEVLLEKLQSQGLIPKKISLGQYEAWNNATEMPFEETLDLGENDIRLGIDNIFARSVVDRHISAEDLQKITMDAKERYNTAHLPLSRWSVRLQELRTKIQEGKNKKAEEKSPPLTPDEEKEYRELQKKISEYRQEHAQHLLEREAGLYLSRFKSVTLADLEQKGISIDGKWVTFQKVFQTLEKVFAESKPDFFQDILQIRGLLHESGEQIFGGKRISKSALRLTDAVDIKTHLKIGESPVESCQNYRSRGGLNEGLLSYIVDPNVKIIQVYDEHKSIIARSILRLLEDQTGNPQLFLERVYSVNAHHKISEAIRAFAREKAKTLECKLYSHEKEGIDAGTKTPETGELSSKNSRSPYVYTDAGGGKVKSGTYTIRGAYRIT